MAITTSCHEFLKGAAMDLRSEIPEQYWELVDQYRAELVSQAMSILGNREDAEDVVQETFIEALRDANLVSGDSIGAKLRLTNKFNALNRLRDADRARTRVERKRHESPTRAFTTGGFSGIELKEVVEKAVHSLPGNLREAVSLRYWKHLSYKEIAERLKIPIGAVGPLLSEASIRLYAKLNEHLPTASGASATASAADTDQTGDQSANAQLSGDQS